MSLEVISGCMFSGKTEELVRRLRRAVISDALVIAFKPAVDARYHDSDIASHHGGTFGAVAVDSVEGMKARLPPTLVPGTVIGFDEAQFMNEEIIDLLDDLAGKDCRVIVAGLDLDYRGVPFGPMPQLLAMADDVTKLSAVCVGDTQAGRCGKRATRSYRVPSRDTGAQVQVGGQDVYEARCRLHWHPEPTPSMYS